ncbi:hypothetical protein [Streptomyces sp. NBC_00316]|uniref:hypothetical protein n=1 Tax=Streptomyces sp. NBC_00316 TaxID=2975710 RepID=UPI002E2CE30E|nr:hypothetical protein [Streptomyces sp. NBC_00316]
MSSFVPGAKKASHGASSGAAPVRHKKHGATAQVPAGPPGGPWWARPAPPGAVHTIRAARAHGATGALARPGLGTPPADLGCQGAGATMRAPRHGHGHGHGNGPPTGRRAAGICAGAFGF